MRKNKVPSSVSTFLQIIFYTGVALDVFYFNFPSDFRYILLLFIWLLILKTLKANSIMSFKLSLGFLALLFVFFIFVRKSNVNERIAAWIYLTMVVGIIQQFFELVKEKSQK